MADGRHFNMTKKITSFISILFLVGTLFAASPESVHPQKYQPEIAGLVSTYLTYYHYKRAQINDATSRNLLDNYLDALDPNKMFFLDSDIREFKKYQTVLDDHLLQSPVNLEAPFFIFNRYKQRVEERSDYILARLEKPFNYEKDEFYLYDREALPWASTKGGLDELWRKRLKEDLVRFKLREKPDDEALDLLKKRYQRIRKSVEEYEPADVLEIFLNSLANTFDPHSSYLKPATKDNFDIQMGHSLEGIGATLQRDGEYTKVVDIVKGGPAFRTKELHAGDKIIAVAQGDSEAEDVVDLRLDKVVKKIRGPKGTTVRLTIIPVDAADQSETREVVIVRDHVEITSADAKSEIKEIKDEEGRIYRFGVINIPSFYMDSQAKRMKDPNFKSTSRDVRKLLKELEEEKVDGVVVDLRQNGGGSLDEAIELTGLFIEDGPVVQIRNHRGRVQVEDDPFPNQVYDGPLLVLTSVFSASASEIFASAIQDYDRGIVVGGKNTHGKGTVQNVLGLQNTLSKMVPDRFEDDVAGALKVTTHKFYRISGGSTQFKGVTPDITLPSPYDGMKLTEESLENALPWDEIDPVKYKSYNQVRDSLNFLRTNSARRVAKDPEFRYVLEDVELRRKLEEDKRVSLNLAVRKKEKDDLEKREEVRDEERELRLALVEPKPKKEDADKDEDKEETEDDKVEVPDFVLEEAIAIIRDYMIFNSNRVALAPGKKESL